MVKRLLTRMRVALRVSRDRLAALRWGTRELLRPVRTLVAISAIIAVICGVLPALQPLLSKHIVDRIVGHDSSATLWLLVAATALTFVLPAIVEPLNRVVSAEIEDHTTRRVDELLIGAGASMPDLTRLEQPRMHDEVERIGWDAIGAQRLATLLLQALSESLGLLVVLLSLGAVNPVVPLLLLAVAIPHLIGERRVRQLAWDGMEDRSREAREMSYCVQTTIAPERAKEIRAFELGSFFLERFNHVASKSLREMAKIRFHETGTASLFSIAYAVAIIGCFVFLAAQAKAGTASVGDLALYLTGVIALAQRVYGVSELLAFSAQTLRSLQRTREFIADSKPGIVVAANGVDAPARWSDRIEFTGVGFTYPVAERSAGDDTEADQPEPNEPVLTDVQMTIPAGSILALVGENGEGKSTLVKLLTRMYDPSTGEIRLDGRPIAEYDLGSLRSRIATVYQDHGKFALTFEENIAIAEPGLLDPTAVPQTRRARVVAAAHAAGADDVAEQIGGYDVDLTRRFGGTELSGGQWQRVATARAFLPDAGLVILDEPTSALDVDAERRLFDTFRELMRGRTAIMISHRFSTVRNADLIAVLADGRVAELGSHDDLMAAGGRYAELFSMQADRYR